MLQKHWLARPANLRRVIAFIRLHPPSSAFIAMPCHCLPSKERLAWLPSHPIRGNLIGKNNASHGDERKGKHRGQRHAPDDGHPPRLVQCRFRFVKVHASFFEFRLRIQDGVGQMLSCTPDCRTHRIAKNRLADSRAGCFTGTMPQTLLSFEPEWNGSACVSKNSPKARKLIRSIAIRITTQI